MEKLIRDITTTINEVNNAKERFVTQNYQEQARIAEILSRNLNLLINFVETLLFWIPNLQKLVDLDRNKGIRECFIDPNQVCNDENPLILQFYYNGGANNLRFKPPFEWMRLNSFKQIEELVNILEIGCLSLIYRIMEIIIQCLSYLHKNSSDYEKRERYRREIKRKTIGVIIEEIKNQNWELNTVLNIPAELSSHLQDLSSLLGSSTWANEIVKRRHKYCGHRDEFISSNNPKQNLIINEMRDDNDNPISNCNIDFPCRYEDWYGYFLRYPDGKLTNLIIIFCKTLKYWAQQNPPIWIFVSR